MKIKKFKRRTMKYIWLVGISAAIFHFIHQYYEYKTHAYTIDYVNTTYFNEMEFALSTEHQLTIDLIKGLSLKKEQYTQLNKLVKEYLYEKKSENVFENEILNLLKRKELKETEKLLIDEVKLLKIDLNKRKKLTQGLIEQVNMLEKKNFSVDQVLDINKHPNK